jgi:predicted permease
VEPSKAVKDSRIAEIAWLAVIAILVAVGGNIVLALLAQHRVLAEVLLFSVVIAAFFGLRRAFLANSATARSDVTKAATYLVAAVLAFVAIGLHVHWAIGACIAAIETALIFDIITLVARARSVPGEES